MQKVTIMLFMVEIGYDKNKDTESVHNIVIYNDILSTYAMRENGIDVGDFSADM